ncbi:MAG TPA: tyrosine-type recombinase/integrase [Pyrinomonadaceae bacterium]|nr:tyrosine-type recombinase/integrase [Pyrinomonadaceae bacterium]
MKACELVGIPYGLHTPNGITLHSLRHTFATRLQDRNIHPYTIMALMGHSSPKMSAVYSHASPDAVEVAVSRLEGRGEVLEFALRQKSANGVGDGFTVAEAIPASG